MPSPSVEKVSRPASVSTGIFFLPRLVGVFPHRSYVPCLSFGKIVPGALSEVSETVRKALGINLSAFDPPARLS